MPVVPFSARMICPPGVACAIDASCCSPDSDSSVVSGLPWRSVRHPTMRPSWPISGIGSGVRPPIWTTWIVVPWAPIAWATLSG